MADIIHKWYYKHFLACLCFYLYIPWPMTAMQRSYEGEVICSPQQVIERSGVVSEISLENLIGDVQNLILVNLPVPKNILKLVNKATYNFFELHGKSWKFTNENYPSFFQNKEELWVKFLLEKVCCLTFYNTIDEPDPKDDDLNIQDWEQKYIFASNETLVYITQHTTSLKKLSFYNFPSFQTYWDKSQDGQANTPFSCATSLTSLSFDYDTRIFDDSISLMAIESFFQFTNLKNLNIHCGLFFNDLNYFEITNFYSSFEHLETLRLDNVECDSQEGNQYATSLFQSLTCLKKLSTLTVQFIQEPDLLPLTFLSSLGCLKHLSVEFEDTYGEDEQYFNDDVLSTLATSLCHLASIRINTELMSFYQ